MVDNYLSTDQETYHPGWGDIETILEQETEVTQRQIHRELEQVEQQLSERESIHETITTELENKIDWYTDRLKKQYRRPDQPGEKIRRLKARLTEFYKELRTEHREHWKDKQQLHEQRRKLLTDLDTLDETSKIIEGL